MRRAGLAIVLTLALAAPASALPRRTGPRLWDRAGILDPASAEAIVRIADEAESWGGPSLYVVTLGSLDGDTPEFIARYTPKIQRRRGEPARDVVLVISRDERRAALVQSPGIETPLTDEQVRRILGGTLEPALAGSDAGPAAVRAAQQILLALGAEIADVAEPYRTRTHWRDLLAVSGPIIGTALTAVGGLLTLLGRRLWIARQRRLAAAGLAPEPVADPPPDPVTDMEWPPMHRGATQSLKAAGGLAGMFAALGLIVPTLRLASWLWAPWIAAFVAWVVIATRSARKHRVAVSLEALRRDGALVAAGRLPAIEIALVLAPCVLLAVAPVPNRAPWLALAGATGGFASIFLGLDWANAGQRVLVTEDGLEHVSAVFRRRVRFRWRDVWGVQLWAMNPRFPALIVRNFTGGTRITFPFALDGIGDLAVELLRRAPPEAFERSEASREARRALLRFAEARGLLADEIRRLA